MVNPRLGEGQKVGAGYGNGLVAGLNTQPQEVVLLVYERESTHLLDTASMRGNELSNGTPKVSHPNLSQLWDRHKTPLTGLTTETS